MKCLTILLIALLLTAQPALADPPSCQFPDDLALTGMDLPSTKAAIGAHQPVTILTIGGSSTNGIAARGAIHTYPYRLSEHLQALLPGAAITVVNRGLAGGSTRARVDRLAQDIADTKPSLVIWAPGSTEAGLSEDADNFANSLREGVARIRAARADLIMIDLQYAPSIARVVDLGLYNNAIAGVADSEGVPLLHRSELMRRWNDSGVFNLDATPPRDRLPTIRRLFDCLAAGLAEGIAAAVK